VVVSVLTPAEILIAARRLAGARPHLTAVAGIVHPDAMWQLCRDVTQSGARVVRDAQQHPGVGGQETPARHATKCTIISGKILLVLDCKHRLWGRHRDQPPTAARYPRGHHKGWAGMNGGNRTKVLVRSQDGRMLAGVCAGLAGYFGLDVTLVRVTVAVVSVLTGGAGALAYMAAWAIIPGEGETTPVAEQHPVT
jgi:phage shock protein PspC (stress-responsive transcriptional regulator)